MPGVDERLKEWATPRQAEIIDLVNKHNGVHPAARAIGVAVRTVFRTLEAVRKKAAVSGYAPEADMTKAVPSPYVVRGTSTYYDRDGEVRGQWVKTQLDRERFEAHLKEYIEWLAEDARGIAKPVKVPVQSAADLLSVYAIGDPHFGLYAWAEEAGDDFDLSKAESLTTAAIERLISCSPPSQRCLILELGDLLHADDNKNATPGSGHALDVDTRYAKVMQVALRTLKHSITRALKKHQEVEVWLIGGNHDPHSSFAISMCLSAYYENEPRVKIDLSPAAFRYTRHGKVLIGSHHGHGIKMEQLPGVMATDRAKDWGETRYRHWYCGHWHHLTKKEFPGCTVETFRTLAARDAWHSAHGYRAGRDMRLIVHHSQFGEVESHRADIAMIQEGIA
jgi:hypothetical protein